MTEVLKGKHRVSASRGEGGLGYRGTTASKCYPDGQKSVRCDQWGEPGDSDGAAEGIAAKTAVRSVIRLQAQTTEARTDDEI